MMRQIPLLAVTLAYSLLTAQAQTNNIALPVIIPPSPEVVQLSNAGKISAGLHTGSANVNIPLFSFAAKSARVDLSLNYSANGLKVDEIPGRAGLGWNLVAGGVVSRTVHGEPDGDVARLEAPANLYAKNDSMYNFIMAATNPGPGSGVDTEWDEYAYSFNGISGRFFLDNNGNGHCIPHTNYKVKVYGFNTASKYVEITTGDGVRYTFGMLSKEKTITINVSGGITGQVSKSAAYETGWFLDRIETPEGNVVTFSYSAVQTVAYTGNYQTMIKPLVNTSACQSGDCTFSETHGTNIIAYDTRLLTGIEYDNLIITPVYESRPDASGDKRITSLTVAAGGSVIKDYRFSYITPATNNNVVNKRFFLHKVRQIEPGSNPEASHDYEFTYDNIDGLPQRLSYAQDWFGYYNGATTNGYFAPYLPALDGQVVNASMGGNRNPGTLAQMRMGSLTVVKYPTGGTETFDYEPHTISQYLGTPGYTNSSVSGSGTGQLTAWTHTSPVFTANADQQATIYLDSYKSPAFPQAQGGEGSKIYELKIKKSGSGEVIFTRHSYYYCSETYTVNLLQNQQYYLELTLWGEANAGSANLHYNAGTNYAYENTVVGGVRVKSIASYDPLTSQTNYRYYTYAQYPELGKSTGTGLANTLNHALYTTANVCTCGGYPCTKECANYMVSASSLSPYYTFSGSHVAYHTVIESNDINLTNGFTEHRFHTSYPAVAVPNIIMGASPLGTPIYLDTDLNGMELATRYYKRMTNGTYVVVKKLEQEYIISDSVQYSRVSLIARRRYQKLPVTYPMNESNFAGFDLVQYYYSSRWIQHIRTTTTDYDQTGANPLISITSRTFGNASHLQPTVVNLSASDGSTQVTNYTYPVDSAVSNPPNVYQKLLDRHRLEIPIKIKESRISPAPDIQTKWLFQKETVYTDWFGDGSVIYPSLVKTASLGGTPESRIIFEAYDNRGNILSMRKANDVPETIIWGYGKQLPAARVVNASAGQVAYTSFEDTDKGHWTYTGPAMTDAEAYSGSRVYALQGGNITAQVSLAGSYVVSYWVKSPATGALVNGSTGSLKQDAGMWKLFEHSLSLSAGAQVTVSGSATIDELRLHPGGAQMSTLTHAPYVGVTSETNVQNQVTRYYYDAYNRLYVIRNRAGEILRQYQYAYNQLVPYNLNATANWMATGVQRCRQVPPNNNYTGEMETEQRDMNSNSPTYLQFRYLITGTSASCQPVSNCTGDLARVIGDSCQTNPEKVIVYTFFNGTQWECMYYYRWNDNHRSQHYYAYGIDACMIMPE